MDPYVLKTLNAERRARRAAVLVTDLGDGRDRVVREGDMVADRQSRPDSRLSWPSAQAPG